MGIIVDIACRLEYSLDEKREMLLGAKKLRGQGCRKAPSERKMGGGIEKQKNKSQEGIEICDSKHRRRG